MKSLNSRTSMVCKKFTNGLAIAGVLLLLNLPWASGAQASGPIIPLGTSPAWVSGDSDPTYALAWGDVDADGDLDLAIGREMFIGVYINQNGGLRPTAGAISEVDGAASALAWGDVNGDGALDLVAGNKLTPSGGSVQVFLNSDKTLLTTAAWEIALDAVSGVALGDVDSDGDLDLVVSSETGTALYLNTGDLFLNTPDWTSVEPNSLGAAWGDSDGDHDLDLVVVGEALYDAGLDTYLTQVSLYLNEDGALATTPVWRPEDLAGEWNTANSAAWTDMDQDGDLDLAVGYLEADNVAARLYRNQGGALETTASWVVAESNDIASVAWGDMNSDKYPDLIVSNEWAASHVYANMGGTLDTTPAWVAAQADLSPAAVPGDVDGDGDLDLAVANQGATTLYENVGATLTRAAMWRVANPTLATDIAWGDVDGDGDLDLALSGSGASLYLNKNGALAQTPDWTANIASQAHSVAWGDVDGDGDLDLAVGTWNDSGGVQSVAQLYVNEVGQLSATAAWVAASSDGPPSNFEMVAWGDVDNDGDLDLAVGALNAAMRLTYQVYLNEGAGLSAAAGWEITMPDYILSGEDYGVDAAWGDVNDDGDLDLAVINSNLSASLYSNRGGRLATEPTWTAADSGHAWSLAWGDVDGDGDLDLAVGNSGQPNKLYRNDNGALQSTATWSSSDADFTTNLAWADVNGDGALDLAAVGDGQPTKVYLNARGTLGKAAAWASTDVGSVRTSLAWGWRRWKCSPRRV
ncbi:MAG TPA: VCBS repeat-containing protein, partial [Anaerolineae bacterium]|nr:VCBS repeat-containing protein [Anaerolineae bacterium]